MQSDSGWTLEQLLPWIVAVIGFAILSWVAWEWLTHDRFKSRRPLRLQDLLRLPRWPQASESARREQQLRGPIELAGLTVFSLIFFIAASLFLWLVAQIHSHGSLDALDRSARATLSSLSWRGLDDWMIVWTSLGGAGVTVPLAIIFALWLSLWRRWVDLSYWLCGALGARVLVLVMKMILARERPALVYDGIELFSFPSGHTTNAAVIYGMLAFMLMRGHRWAGRACLASLAALAVLGVAMSRIVLGVHWASDVGAGLLLGVSWIALLASLYTVFHRDQPPLPMGSAAVALAAVLVPLIVYLSLRFNAAQMLYSLASAGPDGLSGAAVPAAAS